MEDPLDFILSNIPFQDSSTFEISKYVYRPQILEDSREILHVSGRQLTRALLDELENSLSEKQEIAVHSSVRTNGRLRHIPMIDLACKVEALEDAFPVLNRLIFSRLKCNFAIFSSGNSAHIYGDRLLTSKEWVRFNGLLLLCNAPGEMRVIDDRWIGHRLIAGYSALRVSCKSQASKNSGKIKPKFQKGFNFSSADSKHFESQQSKSIGITSVNK